MSIKVAGADGTTHLGTLISGLQWAVDHQSSYGIKVLNISLGFQPTESTVINPLDQAVEAVWNSGIAVVASAGNAGPFNGTILSPGDDPLVITAGALDDMATPSTTDDEMTDFSSVGPTSPDGWVKPDLVTSGRSVVSLAAPGSTIYNDYPSARIGSANFVGSGTSFSAAITSGAAALVLADNPGLTPNQIKARLLGTTNPGPVGNPFVDGHGALNAYAAATSGPMNFSQSAAGLIPTSPGATVSLSPTRPVDTWNASLWSGTSWSQPPSTGWAWNGVGVERQRLERLGLERQGLERRCVERRSLERRRLERLGLERRGPGTDRPGTAPPGTAGPGTAQRGTDDGPIRQSSHEDTARHPGRRRRVGRGRRAYPVRRRLEATGRLARRREPVDRRGRDGRPCPGELGVAGRGVPGRRIRGLQHGRGLLCDPRPAGAAAGHSGDLRPGDRPGPGWSAGARCSSRPSTSGRC